MKAEGSANHKAWKRTRNTEYSPEVGKRLEAGFFIPASDYINALQFRVFALDDFLETVLSKVDVLHTPLLPIPTPTLEQTAYSDGPNYLKMVVALTRNTKVINFLGLPALSVTCGYTSDGMPTSFSIGGPPVAQSHYCCDWAIVIRWRPNSFAIFHVNSAGPRRKGAWQRNSSQTVPSEGFYSSSAFTASSKHRIGRLKSHSGEAKPGLRWTIMMSIVGSAFVSITFRASTPTGMPRKSNAGIL